MANYLDDSSAVSRREMKRVALCTGPKLAKLIANNFIPYFFMGLQLPSYGWYIKDDGTVECGYQIVLVLS